mgnify:CR=1 FL=1
MNITRRITLALSAAALAFAVTGAQAQDKLIIGTEGDVDHRRAQAEG